MSKLKLKKGDKIRAYVHSFSYHDPNEGVKIDTVVVEGNHGSDSDEIEVEWNDGWCISVDTNRDIGSCNDYGKVLSKLNG
jgi:hypothetical protein